MYGWKQQTDHRLRYVLFPLAMLFWGILFWRNLFYTFGFFVSRKLPTKVISIGNITTGGTGKTPAVIYLAKILIKRGKKVAVLSRGYGRKTAGTQLVTDGNTPALDWRNFGDEPTLISKALSGVPVVVDEKRHRGGMFLVDRFNPDVIIMDDAFQHRRIARDLDLVLIDALDPFGSDYLLPRGLLRESPTGLRRADFGVLTRSNLVTDVVKQTIRRRIAQCAPQLELVETDFVPRALRCTNGEEKPISVINNESVAAFCGIGNPAAFRHALEHAGAKIIRFRQFPDHYRYDRADIEDLASWASQDNLVDRVVCTHKDLVKIGLHHLGKKPLGALMIGLVPGAGWPALEVRLRKLQQQIE